MTGCNDGRVVYDATEYANGETISNVILDQNLLSAKAVNGYYAKSIEVNNTDITIEYVPVLMTMDAIFNATSEPGNYHVTFDNWVVSGATNSVAYVTDGTKGFIVSKSGHGFEAGDKINGTAELALTNIDGSAACTNLTSTTPGITVSGGGTITPEVTSYDGFDNANTGGVFTLKSLYYDGTSLKDNVDSEIPLNNAFGVSYTLQTGCFYDVTGIFLWYQTEGQIIPRTAADIERLPYTCHVTGCNDGRVVYDAAEYADGATISNVILNQALLSAKAVNGYYVKSIEVDRTDITVEYVPTLTTMDAIFNAAQEPCSQAVTFGNWVVSGTNTNFAYVTDGTKGFVVSNDGHGFHAGDIISGTAYVAMTTADYNATLTDLTSATEGITVTTGGTVTPQTASIASLDGHYTGSVIVLDGLVYDGTVLKDASDNEITPYDAFGTGFTLTSGSTYKITGVYIQSISGRSIAPRSAGDIVKYQNYTCHVTGHADGRIVYDATEYADGSTICIVALNRELLSAKAVNGYYVKSIDVDRTDITVEYVPTLTTMDAIFTAAQEPCSQAVTFGNWVVSGATTSVAYVTDGTKGFVVSNDGHGFHAGDIISGTAYVAMTTTDYNATLTDLTSATEGITVTTGGTVTPQAASIASLDGHYTGSVIVLDGLVYDGTVLKDASDNVITPYDAFGTGFTLTSGSTYKITGVYIQSISGRRIAPRNAGDIVRLPYTCHVTGHADGRIVYDATEYMNGGTISVVILDQKLLSAKSVDGYTPHLSVNGMDIILEYQPNNEIWYITSDGNQIIPKDMTIDNYYSRYENGKGVIRYYGKTIATNAFKDCSNLTSITMPITIEVIDLKAFENCSSLTSIDIPNVKKIGNNAFSGCSSLTSIDIPNVKEIGWYAFRGCSSLTSIEMPKVKIIGKEAFESCSHLASIAIGNIESLYQDPFYNTNITSVIIYDGTTSIFDDLFHGLDKMTSVTIPASVTSIGKNAFSFCRSLTSITIPASVTSIGEGAFYNCSSLTSITFPISVTSLGCDLFSGCSALTGITCLATTPPTCDENTFYRYSKPVYVPEGTLAAYKAADYWKDLAGLTDELPTTVTLNNNGFATFSAAQDISVKTAGVKAYKAVASGSTIELTELDGYIPAGTGVLLYGAANTPVSFYLYPSGQAATNLAGNSLMATTKADGTLVDKSGVSGTVWVLGPINEFRKYTGAAFGANRAYINYELPSGAPLRIAFNDGGTTLVEDVIMPEQKTVKRIENGSIVIVKNGRKYNLAGQEIK